MALGQIRADEVRAGGSEARDLHFVKTIERVGAQQMPKEVGVQGELFECRIARKAHFGSEPGKPEAGVDESHIFDWGL